MKKEVSDRLKKLSSDRRLEIKKEIKALKMKIAELESEDQFEMRRLMKYAGC